MLTRDAQTSLRLKSDLLDRVRKAAQAAGRSIAAEIDLRLSQSFYQQTDKPTSELLAGIARAAALLPTWHTDQATFRVFKSLVDHLLIQGDTIGVQFLEAVKEKERLEEMKATKERIK